MTEPPASKAYAANCHCGLVTYTVTLSPPLEQGHTVVRCNCSVCTRLGYALVYPSRADVVFHTGWDEMNNYRCGRKVFDNKFCGYCGTSILIDFADIELPMGKGLLGVNVSK